MGGEIIWAAMGLMALALGAGALWAGRGRSDQRTPR